MMSGSNWAGCGSGFAKYDETLRSRYQGSIGRIASDLSPRAREMAQLAVPRFLGGLAVDPADAAPLYIRNKVALKESER